MPQNRLLLLTAFEPFGGRAKNASQEALQRLMAKAADFPSLRLTARFLPVETGVAAQAICRALDEVRPDILLSLGEAKRDTINLERFGYNERRYTIPDNAGNLLDGAPVVPGGPPAYRSTLPLEEILAAVQAAEIPIRLSDDPGRYLCNEVLYSALHHVTETRSPALVAFMHVPHLPEAADSPGYPSMPSHKVVQALSVALGALAKQDVPRG